jgi:hypothetical protein
VFSLGCRTWSAFGALRGSMARECFQDRRCERISIVMTAQECTARADDLIRSMERCRTANLVFELETTANEWRRLAHLADAQAALQAALVATRS